MGLISVNTFFIDDLGWEMTLLHRSCRIGFCGTNDGWHSTATRVLSFLDYTTVTFAISSSAHCGRKTRRVVSICDIAIGVQGIQSIVQVASP